MPKHQLFHEKVNDKLIPYWYVISFKENEITWNKYVMFIEYQMPFEYDSRISFNDSIFSFTIRFSDLVFGHSSSRFGINLKNIRNRIKQHGLDPMLFLQFIIPIPDLNDFLRLILKNKRCIK